ncbi:MAG: PDZ domain-containing protein [bacterium]
MKWKIGTLFLVLLIVSGSLVAQTKVEVTKKAGSGWLGVSIQDITKQLKKSMKLDSENGALVAEVEKKSPAAEAGIKEEDVIVEFNGEKIEDSNDLQEKVGKTAPGTKTNVVVLRDGQKKTLPVSVGKKPKSAAVVLQGGNFALPHFNIFTSSSISGMQLREIEEQLAEYFGVQGSKGVIVENVEKESAADKAGFKAGDVILQAGKKTVDEIRDVTRALGAFDPGEKVDVEVLRKGVKKVLTLEVEEEESAADRLMYFNEKTAPNIRIFKFPQTKRFQGLAPSGHIQINEPDLDELKVEIEKMKDGIQESTIRLKKDLSPVIEKAVRLKVIREI